MVDQALINALAGGYGADEDDDAINQYALMVPQSDGNDDRVQGSAPAMEYAGSPDTPEAAAQGTGPNPVGQVLARLRTNREPAGNGLGSMMGGVHIQNPNMSSGASLISGFAGGAQAHDADALEQQALDEKQYLHNLQAVKNLFDMQKTAAVLKETARHHTALENRVTTPKPVFASPGYDEFGTPLPKAWQYPGQPTQGARGGGTWDRVAAGEAPGAEGTFGGSGLRYKSDQGAELHGDDFLKANVDAGRMTPAEAATIRGYAEGKQNAPTGNSPRAMRARQLLETYDPNYDFTNPGARKAMVDAWAKPDAGKQGGRIESGKRAIDHLMMMSDAADKLKGTNVQVLNMARNAILSGSGGDLGALGAKYGLTPEQAEALRTLTKATDTFTKEAEKFYRGASGSTRDIEAMKKQFDPAQAPNLLHTAIATEIGLMRGQFDEMEKGWHDVMGDKKPLRTIYDPAITQKMARMYKRAGQDFNAPGGMAEAPAQAAPVSRGTGATPSGGGASPSMGGAAQIPAGAIQHLRANPALRDAFDQKYGPGTADRVLR